MFKFLLIGILIALSLQSNAQTQVDSTSVKKVFKLAGKRVLDISNDSTIASLDSNALITEFAVKKFGDSRYVKIQTQNPYGNLTGGISQERLATGTDLSEILTWSAGRYAGNVTQAATANISTINISGYSQSYNQSFTNPTAGSSTSGSQVVSYPRNITSTFTNTITTTDGKTVTYTTSNTFYDKRYIGFAAGPIPTDMEILSAIYQDNNGGTTSFTTTLAQLLNDKYLFYANTSTVTTVTVNGFPSTAAFSLNNSRSFTNASGGTTTYYVTVSNNALGSVGTTNLTVN